MNPWMIREEDLRLPAVLGTISARKVITSRPIGRPPIAISKNTSGLGLASISVVD
jgi:hypothetical protein